MYSFMIIVVQRRVDSHCSTMEAFYGADPSIKTSAGGLGQFQLIMMLSILTGLPFGPELLLKESTAAVGYLLLFGLALSLFLILPLTLILSWRTCSALALPSTYSSYSPSDSDSLHS